MSARMSSGEVRTALKAYYPHPEYGLVFEVAQGTGWKANRHLDCMAMSLYPSRGLHLYGIEIKVDRGDWRREKAQPAKAEELARFCDEFWIAAPVGIVPLDELPANWGLLEVDSGKVKKAKGAVRLHPEPVGRDFLAAVFRAASRGPDPDMQDAAVAERLRELEAGIQRRVDDAVKRKTAADDKDATSWRKLCEALGAENAAGAYGFGDEALISAIKAVHTAGIAGSYAGLKNMADTMERNLKRLRDGIAVFGQAAESET